MSKITRKITAALAAAALAATLAGCSSSDDSDEYQEVCLNSADVRVPDYQCDSSTAGTYGYTWFWYPIYYPIPSYGTPMTRTAGVPTPPATARKATVRPSGAGATAQPRSRTFWPKSSTPTTGTGGGTSRQQKAQQPRVNTRPIQPPRVQQPRVQPPRVSVPRTR